MENKTIEEVASFNRGYIAGAKNQNEQMYSEEDMIEFAQWVYLEIGSNKGKVRTNNELLEQFKKS
jgi:hypothetical protein